MPKINLEEDVTIRVMRQDDLDALVNIDAQVFGRSRPGYYERKLAVALDQSRRLANSSLVAEYEGRVVGFIMGDVYLGEFGIPETTASVDTIGVHPDFQRSGIARALLDEFIANARKAGVETIYTLVNWNDWDLLRFFDSVGFAPARTMNLELSIK